MVEISPDGFDKVMFGCQRICFAATRGQRFYETMLENGLITELESRRNLENVVVVMHPALITSRENVDEAVEIIDKSLDACLK